MWLGIKNNNSDDSKGEFKDEYSYTNMDSVQTIYMNNDGVAIEFYDEDGVAVDVPYEELSVLSDEAMTLIIAARTKVKRDKLGIKTRVRKDYPIEKEK